MLSFPNYTEHFVLYYIYRSNQVRLKYSSEDLLYVAVPMLVEQMRILQEEQETVPLT
jgi:hypothetical protein